VTNTIKPDIYPKVDDEAVIVLKYPKAVAIIQASWNWPFDRKDMEVYGQKGYVITVSPGSSAGAASAPAGVRGDVRVRRPNEREEQLNAKDVPAPYNDPLTEFRAVILDGAQPDGMSSLATNLIVTEILDAARTSAETGKTRPLPLKK
jgi:predicted dehydrogenase